MPKFQSTKTYGTDRGLSCCFRQWKANHSHCSTLHGYSLGFKFVFESETLDEKNWCFDFGGMKPIKNYLDHMFDHTVLVAEDDPALTTYKLLALESTMQQYRQVPRDFSNTPFQEGRLLDLRVVPGVGCEMTAKMVYEETVRLLEEMKTGKLGRYAVNPDVRLVSVECFEHGSNSAIYFGDQTKQVTTIDVSNMDTDDVQYYLEHIREAIRARKTVNSEVVSVLTDALEIKPRIDGDLTPFVDVVNDLNKVPPIGE